MTCGESERDRWVVADEVSRIVVAGGIWKSMQERKGGIALERCGGGK